MNDLRKIINRHDFLTNVIPIIFSLFLFITMILIALFKAEDSIIVTILFPFAFILIFFLIIAIKKTIKKRNLLIDKFIDDNLLVLYEIEKNESCYDSITYVDAFGNVKKEYCDKKYYFKGFIDDSIHRKNCQLTLKIQISKEIYDKVNSNTNVKIDKDNILKYKICSR